jgi:hypothetical protein
MDQAFIQTTQELTELFRFDGGGCPEGSAEYLCSAKDVGLESHLVCLEEHPFECKFAVSFGLRHFCHCTHRVHIAKYFKM